MKSLIVILMMVSSSSYASDKVICVNRGNLDGSYSLDITGYEEILDGKVKSFSKILNFKRFRSFEQPITNLVCSKPNSYLDGPSAVLACRSGAPANDYGPIGNVPFEAIVYEYKSKLLMRVTGPDIEPSIEIYCELRN